MMHAPPVFVVGAPRSGTTLLSAMLSSHSALVIGPESHFFKKSTPAARRAAVQGPWPDAGVDLLMSLTLTDESVPHLFGMDRERLRAWLREQEPSERALLESLTRTFAEKRRKGRWGEKTPGHVQHLHEIRRLYPEAPIIHIVRDPRDTVRSIARLPWASRSPFVNAYLWSRRVRAGMDFAADDEHTLTLRFEDLLERPEEQLRRLCDFIGEPYDPAMLDTAAAAEAMRSGREIWKLQVGQALDRSKAYRWRSGHTVTDPDTVSAISLICHREIEQLGYEDPIDPRRELRGLWLSRARVEEMQTLLYALARERTLLHPEAERDTGWEHLAEPDTVVCDTPPLPSARRSQARLLTHLTARFAAQRLAGDPVSYLLPPPPRGSTLARLAWGAVERLGKPYRVA